VRLRGDVEAARAQIQARPWVTRILSGEHLGEATWQVSVKDPKAAETELLKILVNGPVVVTEFRRKQYELEDIFMQVVEGGQHVRQ
jgi:hypothetical protein